MIDEFFTSQGINIDDEITGICHYIDSKFFTNTHHVVDVLQLDNNSTYNFTLLEYPEGTIQRLNNARIITSDLYMGFDPTIINLPISSGLSASTDSQLDATFIGNKLALFNGDSIQNVRLDLHLQEKTASTLKQELLIGIKSLLYALYTGDADMVFYIIKETVNLKNNIVSENDRPFYNSNVNELTVDPISL